MNGFDINKTLEEHKELIGDMATVIKYYLAKNPNLDIMGLLDSAIEILMHIALSSTNEEKGNYVKKVADGLVKKYSE